MMRYEKSRALYERACRSLAGGVSSEFRRFADPPLFYDAGRGSHIVDVDGNDYLDFTLSQGPLILGHSHPAVLAAVERASARGQLFAGQHTGELELAEKLQQLIPCAQRMRFGLSGSEAVQAALRAARAVMVRPRFLRFEGHYHGWLDNVAFGVSALAEEELGPRQRPHLIPWSAGLPAGIGEQCVLVPWNDLELVEQAFAAHRGEIAAVITEPVMCNSGCIGPERGFLEGLRDACHRHQAMLIFDEVITGFRLGLGGAQAFFNVTPDLAVFGKALANGYPISVLAGTTGAMQAIAGGQAIQAGTMNSGNPSVAAALATLSVLENEAVHPRLFELGRRLMEGLRHAAGEANQPLLIQGYGPMFHAGFTQRGRVRDFRDTLDYDLARYAAFVRGMQDRGIRLIGRGLWYLSAAHTAAEIDTCISTARQVLSTL